MKKTRKHKLIEIEWPEFGESPRPPTASWEEFQSRIEAARFAMEKHALTHLVVYGDREHFANLAYLTGFDPRFEEAVLILGQRESPLLIVGNECESYLNVSPLWVNSKLRSERFQPFSLLNQPRDNSRFLREIFSDEGICRDSLVGCAGWKYFSDREHPQGMHTIDLPAYLVDTLRDLVSYEKVINATGMFVDPDCGLRTFCSTREIAYFEYTNVLASEGMKRILFGVREGMRDHELAQLARYNGEPLGCHTTLVTGDNRTSGLTSPMCAEVRRGDPLATNICYWGSNSCRAGWVASSARDLPHTAQDYVAQFAGIYFEAMSEWLQLLSVGRLGGELDDLIRKRLPFEKFGIFLNPGHLIHLDEWVSSPIYPGSQVPIHSGMVFQVDVIPASATYFSTRMEDGIVIADQDLRHQLQHEFPECFSRCQRRREFMRDVLGIELAEEALPLSNIAALVPPLFLAPHQILAMER
jgi:Xaa-Pro aminopeptidase